MKPDTNTMSTDHNSDVLKYLVLIVTSLNITISSIEKMVSILS